MLGLLCRKINIQFLLHYCSDWRGYTHLIGASAAWGEESVCIMGERGVIPALGSSGIENIGALVLVGLTPISDCCRPTKQNHNHTHQVNCTDYIFNLAGIPSCSYLCGDRLVMQEWCCTTNLVCVHFYIPLSFLHPTEFYVNHVHIIPSW